MDMKRHMLICFFISMLVNKAKKWGSYKMEVVIRKSRRYLLKKYWKKKTIKKEMK
jgi:hypothetical protein